MEKATREQEAGSLLVPVWENGRALVTQSFANVRATLEDSAAYDTSTASGVAGLDA